MNKLQRIVLALVSFLALAVPSIGTANAQGSDCAVIGSKAPPLSIVKGFNGDWIGAFDFLPFVNTNCPLNARLTINPGFVEFGVLQIDAPYTCVIASLTDARCTGTAKTRATLSVRLHGRAVGQSGITVNVNGKTFFYSVFVVSPTQIYLPLVIKAAGTVKAAGTDQTCGIVSTFSPPHTINVGERKRWTEVFSFSPDGPGILAGCDLTATVTSVPANVSFRNTAIDLPYHCIISGGGQIQCLGTGSGMTQLDTDIVGVTAGSTTLEVNVNGKKVNWIIDVIDVTEPLPPVPANKLFLPLING